MTSRFVLLLMFLSLLLPLAAPAQTAATTYLQSASDRYQRTVDVYSVANAAGNHFAARGEFDANNGLLVQTQVLMLGCIGVDAPETMFPNF